MGKGSRVRPTNKKLLDEGFDRIFGERKSLVCDVCGKKSFATTMVRSKVYCDECYSWEGVTKNVDPWRNHESDAAGCHPSQASEFEADARKRGVPTEFDRNTGVARFRSRKHQRQYLKAYGMINRDDY